MAAWGEGRGELEVLEAEQDGGVDGQAGGGEGEGEAAKSVGVAVDQGGEGGEVAGLERRGDVGEDGAWVTTAAERPEAAECSWGWRKSSLSPSLVGEAVSSSRGLDFISSLCTATSSWPHAAEASGWRLVERSHTLQKL